MSRVHLLLLVAAVVVAGALVLQSQARPAHDRMTIHEWGTFTTLQDEKGRGLAGINTDDEPVPPFVHRHPKGLILPADPIRQPLVRMSKSLPMHHPQVVMRMETPVIYFYPPKSQAQPIELDIAVDFHGGWLTEFYPRAHVTAPGIVKGRVGALPPETVGRLEWKNLLVGAEGKLPETKEEVWLAPRRVRAANVQTTDGETEKYLFYRGVGNLPSPLKVIRPGGTNTLQVHTDFSILSKTEQASVRIPDLWLVDIRPDHAVAFRALGSADAAEGKLLETPATFGPADYHSDGRTRLRRAMHQALVADGLFDDEATAMLDTWDASYFRSPGLRLFYVMPKAWTDHVLPLHVSKPADISRTMVGRIEIITPKQRQLIQRIATGPTTKANWLWAQVREGRTQEQLKTVVGQLMRGEIGTGDLGLKPPADFQAYLDLGRFRAAILLDEAARRPTAELKKFMSTNRVGYYRTVKARPKATTAAIPKTI